MAKKGFYLRCEYSKIEFNAILERTMILLRDIRMRDDVSVKSAKEIKKVASILLELQFTDIKNDDVI